MLNLSYAMNVDCRQHRKAARVFSRGDVYVNGELPVLQADKCVAMSGRCIYPLELMPARIEEDAYYISNLEDVHRRWQILREQLLLRYEGEFAEKLVLKMDAAMEEPIAVESMILNNIFFQLYTMPLHADENHPATATYQQGFSLIDFCAPVLFSCRRTLKKENGGYLAEITGKCIDKRSYTDLVYSKANVALDEDRAFCNGNLSLWARLTSTGTLLSVKGVIGISSDINESREIKVSMVYDPLAEVSPQDFEPAITEEKRVGKRPFWKLF